MEQIVDDDEFEDLYSDVEALARSSVITNAEKLEIDDDKEGDEGGENVILDCWSDSEDDLNILLNDDDFCPAVSRVSGNVKNGVFMEAGNGNEKDACFGVASTGVGFDGNHLDKMEQESASKGVDTGNSSQNLRYMCMKHSREFHRTAKDNLVVAASDYVRKNEWNEYNCSGSNQVAQRHLTTEASCFKLPMMRKWTILNEDIDEFDHKPWRNSGVDVTDFFNFGFNEQSWKEYCRSVAHQCKLKYEEMHKEAIARSFKQPKGRAIQVERGIGQRQSSMDVKHPRTLDSDVVIQIIGEDSAAQYSSSDEDLDHKSDSLLDPSQNENTSSTVSTGVDKVPIMPLEGTIRNSDMYSAALPRCSQQEASFNSTSMDSDKCGNGQLSDLEKKHNIRHNFSVGNAVTMEPNINEKKVLIGDSSRTDPSTKATESSYDGQLQLTPSSSLFGSQSYASEDDESSKKATESSFDGQLKLTQSSSLFGSQSVASEDDVERNRRGQSLDSVAELPGAYKPGYYVNSSDNINARDKPCYSKESARRNRSLLRERQTTCSRRPHDKSDGGGESPTSNKKFLGNKYHSHVIRRGKHESRHNFGYYHNEDTSLYRETYHHNERLTDRYHRDGNPKCYWVQHKPRFKDEIGPYYKRRCSGSQYFDNGTTSMRDYYRTESRVSTKDTKSRMQRESMKWVSEHPYYKRRCNGSQDFDKGTPVRDYYRTESRVPTKDTESLMRRKSMKWDSECPFYIDKGKDTRWTSSRSGDVHYFKNNERSDPWLDYGLVDDFMQSEKQQDLPFPERHCGCMDERCSRCAVSTMENFGRRDDSRRWDRFVDCPTLDVEYSRLRGIISNGPRHVDHDPYSSMFRRQSHSHTTNVQRRLGTVSPEDDVFDFGFTDVMPGRSRRESYSEKFQDDDGWLSEKDAADYDIASFSNLGRSARIGSHFHSRAFLGAERKFFSRPTDYEIDSNDTSLSNERDARVHATNGYSHGRIVMDEMETEEHQYKRIVKGNGGRFLSTSSKLPYTSKNDQNIARCSDSVDFVGWVGKFNERRTVTENFMCNDKSWKEKVEIDSNQEKNNWLNKFPVSLKCEGLEVEEGQIVTEEVDMGRVMKDENAGNGNKVVPVEGINEDRIRQLLAKMEKRRERFKEPIASSKEDMGTNPQPRVDAEKQKSEITQGRPVRKRKWGKS